MGKLIIVMFLFFGVFGTSISYGAEILVWLMASEVSSNTPPTTEEIRAFKKRYPHASIAINHDDEYSRNVLMANEATLQQIEDFQEFFRKNRDSRFGTAPVVVKVQFMSWHENPLDSILNHSRKEGVDIVQIGSTWTALLADKGIIANISEFMKALEHTFVNTAMQSGQYGEDHAYYAVPWSLDIRTWFYNQALLDRAGIHLTEQTDLQSLKTMCVQFKKHVGNAWLLGIPTSKDDFSTLHMAMTWIWGWGGTVLGKNDRVEILEKPVVESLVEYVQLAIAGCAPLPQKEKNGLRLIDIEKQFLAGHYGLTFIGPWILDMIPKNQTHQFINFGSIPGLDGASSNMFIGGSHLALVQSPRTSLEEEAAKSLLHYLAVHANHGIGLSPQKSRLNHMLKEPSLRTYPKLLLDGEARSFPTSPEWGDIERILLARIAEIFRIVGNTPQLNESELRHIIVQELSQAKSEMEAVLPTPKRVYFQWALGLAMLFLIFTLLRRHHLVSQPGKEDLIKRFRHIKSILHMAKVCKGQVTDDTAKKDIRSRLERDLDDVMEELQYFRKTCHRELQHLATFMRNKECIIGQYRMKVRDSQKGLTDYEDMLIEGFEHDLRPIINEMSNMIESYCVTFEQFVEIIKDLKKEFTFDYKEDKTMGSVFMSKKPLRICLYNLLANAHQATQHLSDPQMTLTVSRDNQFVIIAIADNGQAFPETDIKKLARMGEGIGDTTMLLEEYEGELLIPRPSHSGQKPAVTMKLKQL